MKKPKPKKNFNMRKDPRKRDVISEISVVVRPEGLAIALAESLRNRSLLNHLNRTLLHFEFPDGHVESYTVWPCTEDNEAYRRACDQLNWSEH